MKHLCRFGPIAVALIVVSVVLYRPPALEAQAPPAAKRYAVLVGVENYDHPRLKEPVPLKYAVDDVTALADTLTKLGYEVVLLTDDSAAAKLPTKAHIDAEIRAVLRKCRPEDTVLLAFAGHGLQFGGQKDAYFCPRDARPFQRDVDTLVSITGIYEELESSFAGAKVILVDACRNDPDPGRGRGLDADSAPPPPKGVAALFSCSAGQRAFEHDELKHGVFFHHVLEAFAGEAAERSGDVTFYSLASYLGGTVPATMARLFPGREQFPNFKADLVGRPPVLARVTVPAPSDFLTNTLGMPLKLIPAGEFLMGSPASEADRQSGETQHRVRLTRPFYLGVHEVTKGQFAAFVRDQSYRTEAERDGKGGYGHDDQGNISQKPEYTWKNPGFAQGDDHPVVNVSWNDAQAFCQWLSRKEGRTYRLPTEAEWEYACRAGTTTTWQHGNDPEGLAQVGNVADATAKAKYAIWSGTIEASDGFANTAPVGRYRPNAFGLHDLHGNVWEWCADWYDTNYYGSSSATDPPGPTSGSIRVYRGGSWDGTARGCRSANRDWDDPSNRSSFLGFRLALSPSGQ